MAWETWNLTLLLSNQYNRSPQFDSWVGDQVPRLTFLIIFINYYSLFKETIETTLAFHNIIRQPLSPSHTVIKLCIWSRVQLKCDDTWRRTGGEVKGKLANGVGTQYPSHYLGTWCITTADAHTSAASSRLNWRPRRFKWTRPFRRKMKSGFCPCAITFLM